MPHRYFGNIRERSVEIKTTKQLLKLTVYKLL